jgi:hypothetical protein
MASIKINVSINGTSTDYRLPNGVVSANDLAANAQFRDDFSLSSNITVLLNGSEVSRAIRAGDTVTIRQNAARKAAARPRVTVSVNGSSEQYFLPVGVSTATQLAASSEFREAFGLPTNITVIVNGVESSGSLASNDLITVRQNAARKA